VLPASAVNVLPVVAGEEVAVSEAIASPSGSDALTTNDSGRPARMVTCAGAVTTGAWSPVTVICVIAEPLNVFAAKNVTE
jgi:hypothetical protein